MRDEAKEKIKGAFEFIGTMFFGTDRQVKQKKRELAQDIDDQVERRRRRLLNVIDTEGEAVDDGNDKR